MINFTDEKVRFKDGYLTYSGSLSWQAVARV